MFEEIATKVAVMVGVVYGLVEAVKPIYDPSKREHLGDKVAAILFGVTIAVAAQIDVFPAVGIPLGVPFLGAALTGMIAVGGGKAVHDLIGLFGPRKVSV